MRDDANHGLWVVALTEFTALAAAFLLWDVYDNRRLWVLSGCLIRFIRELNLTEVLGGVLNYAEVRKLLDVIDEVDWASVP